MQRLFEQALHRPKFGQPASVHHADAIHALRHQPHVVPHQNHRGVEFLLHAEQGVHHPLLHDHV